jgi:hypothetical protein
MAKPPEAPVRREDGNMSSLFSGVMYFLTMSRHFSPLPALVLIVGWLASPHPGVAQEDFDRLFASHEVLEFTIETDVDRLRRDRDEDAEQMPGSVLVQLPDGNVEVLPVKVRTRGHFRLDPNACWFPPIRLNFRTRDLGGTTFQGQDKLKLVTHCQQRREFEQNVIEEYLVYRLYNLLTEISFRVRLVRVTYIDINGGDDNITRFGVVIEADDMLAERLGGDILEMQSLRPAIFDAEQAALLSVFQYMVGNTDWSMVVFHNVEVLRRGDGSQLPIPYDFDWTGVVDAQYARPDPQFRTGSVRQRVFRGFCRPTIAFDAVFDRFRNIEQEAYQLIRDQEGLSERNKGKLIAYLEEFYEVIDDPGKARDRIVEACREGT